MGSVSITRKRGAARFCAVQKWRMPTRINHDLTVFKNFAITESVKVQFRWETFNALNHPNFGNPNSTFVVGSTNFGNITGTATNNRQQQLGLKLLF